MSERDAPYVQIIERYRQEIRAGRLEDGDMLPARPRDRPSSSSVSLATAAKVAGGLQALGLVTPRPGAGDRGDRIPAAPPKPGPRRPAPDYPGLAHPDAAR